MRGRWRWFRGGALLVALVLGTAGQSFAQETWSVDGYGTVPGTTAEIASFWLQAQVSVPKGGEEGESYTEGGFFYSEPLERGGYLTITGNFYGGGSILKKGSPGGTDEAQLLGVCLIESPELGEVKTSCAILVGETGKSYPGELLILVLDVGLEEWLAAKLPQFQFFGGRLAGGAINISAVKQGKK